MSYLVKVLALGVVGTAVVYLLLGYASDQHTATADCSDRGGVIVRTMWGYTCALVAP